MHVFTVEGSTRFRTGMEEIVASGAAPGVVALLGDGNRAQTVTFGVADIATGEPMREDAIFRIQSMTKPVLAVATMQLVEQGVLSLHDPSWPTAWCCARRAASRTTSFRRSGALPSTTC